MNDPFLKLEEEDIENPKTLYTVFYHASPYENLGYPIENEVKNSRAAKNLGIYRFASGQAWFIDTDNRLLVLPWCMIIAMIPQKRKIE